MHIDRKTDGALPESKMKAKQKSSESGSKNDSNFFRNITQQVTSKIEDNANTQFATIKTDLQFDSLMNLVDLNSIHKMDSLSEALQYNYTKWDSIIINNTIEENVIDIQKNINTVKIEELKDLPNAIAAIKVVQKAIKESDSIKKEIGTLKDNFQSDFSNSTNSIKRLDQWIDNDIKKAQNVAKLPKINAQSIGIVLFGETLLSDLNRYLEYLAMARAFSQHFIDEKNEQEKPARYEGKDYSFSEKYDVPSFWVKKIEVSGLTNNNTALFGVIENLSTDQSKTDKPVKINLSGKNESNTQMTLTGLLDYTSEDRKESITYAYSGFSLANTKLSPSELLPYDLKSGKGSLAMNLTVENKKIESSIEFQATGLDFDFESAEEQVGTIERLVKKAISDTDQIKATALINNTSGVLKANVNSNIDDIFLNTLQNSVQNEVELKRLKIEQSVKHQVKDKKLEVLTLINGNEAKLNTELKKLEVRIYDQIKQIEDTLKMLEAKKKELEQAAKDGAVDSIRKKLGF